MRPAVLDFARDVAERLPLAEPVVEFGARAADGQEGIADLRSLFPVEGYTGCDIQEGIGVDRIEDLHALTFEDDSIGTIICLETLEHVADPLRAVEEMHRVLKPGGVMAISSLMFFPIHAHPWDYWRFTPEAFGLLLQPFESSLVIAQGWELMPEGVFGIGVKGPAGLEREMLPRTVARADSWGAGKSVDLGPMRMSVRELWAFTLRNTGTAVSRRLSRK